MDQLRGAAGGQHRISRMIRVGTVNAATVSLLIPTVQGFRATHPLTQVEVVGAQQSEIHRALSEGSLGLGLVNHLEGDDLPADSAGRYRAEARIRGRCPRGRQG